MNEFKHTKGPLKVIVDNKWPFTVRTFDTDGNIVFSRELPCYSTSDKCADDAINCISFPADKRDEYSAMNKKAIADETLRAAAPEMLDALIDFVRWHKKQFEDNDGCPFNCACEGSHDCYECIHVKFCNYTNIIERATGMSIDEAIQAWEAHND